MSIVREGEKLCVRGQLVRGDSKGFMEDKSWALTDGCAEHIQTESIAAQLKA